MAGSVEGGKLAAKKNKQLYGPNFYREIGKIGGMVRGQKGFGSPRVGFDGLTGQERARVAGQIGGFKSKRGKNRLKEE